MHAGRLTWLLGKVADRFEWRDGSAGAIGAGRGWVIGYSGREVSAESGHQPRRRGSAGGSIRLPDKVSSATGPRPTKRSMSLARLARNPVLAGLPERALPRCPSAFCRYDSPDCDRFPAPLAGRSLRDSFRSPGAAPWARRSALARARARSSLLRALMAAIRSPMGISKRYSDRWW